MLDGTLETLRTHGIAGVSARSIAATAGVNQALIFYHFGSVDELLAAACRHGAERRVARFRPRFAEVTSLQELLELGREIHAEERAERNVAVLAQMLAGSQTDPRLAPATAAGLDLWIIELEALWSSWPGWSRSSRIWDRSRGSPCAGGFVRPLAAEPPHGPPVPKDPSDRPDNGRSSGEESSLDDQPVVR